MSMTYPLNTEVDHAERVARWRPLLNWLLALPLFLWLQILQFGASGVAVVAWFAIVVTGRLPESLGDYLMAVLRYQWRVYTFLIGFTDRYPGFTVVAGYVDPGDYPAVLYSARPARRRRASVLFRVILVIPQAIVLFFLSLVAYLVLIIGWFAALIVGRWPLAWLGFVVDWLRWVFRVNGYWLLIVDDYPPFRLGP
jgi:Domain of unknown function (DUF4389)